MRMKAQVSAVSCHLVSPNWARYQVARVGGSEDIASDLNRFNTNYPTHLTSGVFLLVRPQVCHVPTCLYIPRVFLCPTFSHSRGGQQVPRNKLLPDYTEGHPMTVMFMNTSKFCLLRN